MTGAVDAEEILDALRNIFRGAIRLTRGARHAREVTLLRARGGMVVRGGTEELRHRG